MLLPWWQGHFLFNTKVFPPVTTSWSNINALSINTNGIKKNGQLFIQHTISKYAISCIQDTRLRDQQHLKTFRYHLDSTFRNKIYTSDHNSLTSHPNAARVNGVMTILRSDFPGFESAMVIDNLTVINRYIVVRVLVNNTPLYIHNVYAPVDSSERKLFFDHLNTELFEPQATHMVFGDLNTTLYPNLDASNSIHRHESSRLACLEWLSKLGVVDAWRQHHPEDRVFTGTLPRKNRLDYILMSECFFNHVNKDSSYFVAKHGGDHLAHQVIFSNPNQLHGKGFI